MHDEPDATEEEHAEGPGRRREEDAMRQAGHDDPERGATPEGDEDE